MWEHPSAGMQDQFRRDFDGRPPPADERWRLKVYGKVPLAP